VTLRKTKTKIFLIFLFLRWLGNANFHLGQAKKQICETLVSRTYGNKSLKVNAKWDGKHFCVLGHHKRCSNFEQN